MKLTKQKRIKYCNCRTMYLDYINNFLTVERFAEYYNLPIANALEVIKKGRK